MMTDAGLALASWLLCILVLVLTLLAVAHWHARPVVIVEDPTPFEPDESYEPDPVLAVDPPVVPAYIANVSELDDMLRHATDPKVRDLLLDRRNAAMRGAV